ncbi:hypothetical protein A2334_01040 [Candidatus Roizmanbacteria bacterium RIFOXYB2_FULL_38_10]|uniref:DDH domain-containing protein n=1 Tax=Candidatus Roizmanbacteria bacterium RIFOXYD1_FULL_38_12 TaxID=1802093 RepID=A0A1F7L1G9_9BACT|nr:MAG: hypothetical protein A3K47_04335 [Candidatus Roizmanbacteria bacterium RIFOXYA2_FULL_38_14]OGK63982.1 MAG: hypothetical protein A3K27_04335 [Candidatus Roizmanbacteria bacterium RIFOXYA1_FULL_37_12]OGK65828.1 MAG: hypothetical protein A3K38_04335 [Candidatus Roizmanbacteria bacterium RIFOXYB1_FULL_40_23]OGK68936.1 MAG: hypothetical protein A2334_01040 [Candidatus Roizmanbacteria bacterium RIFOXYB2_FULL_38_10]OGK70233.1 MAG: hypothetical protein A3K21_04340 [Candidatus Roizmanbacteria ba
MHFTQSKKIWDVIMKSKQILLNIHRNPDLDSVGSALAMQTVLMGLGKKTQIIGPHPINPDFMFLPHTDNVKIVDYKTYDIKPFDLFIILDSGSDDIVTGQKGVVLPSLPTIVIDHHKNNTIHAQIKLVDDHASSTAEILYHLFEDWKIKMTPHIATLLFAGACHDTMFFKYNENEVDTFQIAAKLIEKGAKKNKILTHVYNNLNLLFIKHVGTLLTKIKIQTPSHAELASASPTDKGIPKQVRDDSLLKVNFAWVALSYEEYEKMGLPLAIREYVADHFIQSIKNTGFGIVMIEEEKGKLCISFRGKEEYDMSSLARKLGGGGHLLRAGATLYGDNFDEMVKQVLLILCSNQPLAPQR